MFICIYLLIIQCTCVQNDFLIRWRSYRLAATRRVQLVKQEQLSLSESLLFCVVFFGAFFVFLSAFIWLLHSLSFDLCLLIFWCHQFSLRMCHISGYFSPLLRRQHSSTNFKSNSNVKQQNNIVTWKHSFPLICLKFIYQNVSNN